MTQTTFSMDEVTFQNYVSCVVMPCCGFTFAAEHCDDVDPPTYTCPVCAPVELVKDLKTRYEEHDYDPPLPPRWGKWERL